MQWLKDLLKSLPLETLSEMLAEVVFLWVQLVSGIPKDKLSLYVYVGGSVLVLLLLLVFLRIVPRMFRGVIWVVSAGILLTPGTTLGGTGELAPAIIGVLHGFLMGDKERAIAGILSILAVIIAGLILGAMWQLLRAVIEYYFGNTEDDEYEEEYVH